jgi:mRNA-degrading endonuclease HigB of HigAB toxin-antitoxin module
LQGNKLKLLDRRNIKGNKLRLLKELSKQGNKLLLRHKPLHRELRRPHRLRKQLPHRELHK